MGMVEHLSNPGFAREMPKNQSRGSYGQVSYAAYLNGEQPSVKSTEQAAQSIEKPTQKRGEPRSLEDATTFTFPSIKVIRKLDRSRLGSEHRNFFADLGDMAHDLGLRALPLSDIQLVLISPATFNDAMTERYGYHARRPLDKPGLRNKAARETVRNTRNYVAAASLAHHKTVAQLTGNERHNPIDLVTKPKYFKWLEDVSDNLGDKKQTTQAQLKFLMNPDQLLNKAYSLWQPMTADFDEFTTVGPRSLGIALGDDSGVFRTEATMIGMGISRKDAKRDPKNDVCDFNPGHFRIAKNMQWELTLLESPRPIADLPRLEMPESPMDWPLTAPMVYSQV